MSDIRVLIADDHAIVREGLRTLLRSEAGMQVVGEAADGVEAVAMTRALQPDVVIMDLVMPLKDGLEAIREITAEAPHARILVLSTFAEDERVYSAIKAGALGYILKDALPDELLQAIREVFQGTPVLDSSIAFKLIRDLEELRGHPSGREVLSAREVEVLGLVARGLKNREIGGLLDIRESTVITHVRSILSKLQLANRTQAALYAVREGIARLP